MSLERSYKCDGCGRIMPPGAPCLSLSVEETEVEEEGRRRRRKRWRGVAGGGGGGGERHVQIDLCGDCRGLQHNLSAILDRLVPPMKVCPDCDGDGEVLRGAGINSDVVECRKCGGTGEVAA